MKVAVIATLVASALGGCASMRVLDDADRVASSPSTSPETPSVVAPSVASTPSPSIATPRPDAAPSPVTAPPRLPALGDLVVTPEGLGSLIIGAPVDSTDMVVWDADACAEYGNFEPGDPSVGRWVANYDTGESGPPFGMVTDSDDSIGAIEIRSTELLTAEGIGLDSTLEELRAAYPELKDLESGRLSALYAVDDGDGRITFEVVHQGDYWPEAAGRVAVMRIVTTDAPAPLVVATDAVLGSCL